MGLKYSIMFEFNELFKYDYKKRTALKGLLCILLFLISVFSFGCGLSSLDKEVSKLEKKYFATDDILPILQTVQYRAVAPDFRNYIEAQKKKVSDNLVKIREEKVSKDVEKYKRIACAEYEQYLLILDYCKLLENYVRNGKIKTVDFDFGTNFIKIADRYIYLRYCRQYEVSKLKNQYEGSPVKYKDKSYVGAKSNKFEENSENFAVALTKVFETENSISGGFVEVRPERKFVILKMVIANNTKNSIVVDNAQYKLVDAFGKEYSTSLEAQKLVKMESGVDGGFSTRLQSSERKEFKFIFDVPAGIQKDNLFLLIRNEFSEKMPKLRLNVLSFSNKL